MAQENPEDGPLHDPDEAAAIAYIAMLREHGVIHDNPAPKPIEERQTDGGRRWKPPTFQEKLHRDLLDRGWRFRIIQGKAFYSREKGGPWHDLANAVILACRRVN